MKYQGGKSKIATSLGQVIDAMPTEVYYEPFVGGGSVLAQVCRKVRIASDANADVIAMWQAVQNGWQPPCSVSESTYKWLLHDWKRRLEAQEWGGGNPMAGFVGHACSRGGKWWGGYGRGDGRNFAAEGARRIEKIKPRIVSSCFRTADYRDIDYLDGSAIYFDPPYSGTSGYLSSFDHGEFWDLARQLSGSCYVLTSELSAPDDFVRVWEKPVRSGYVNNGTAGAARRESLWALRGGPADMALSIARATSERSARH